MIMEVSLWIAFATAFISWRAFDLNNDWLDRMMLRPYRVWQYREYWRIVTHAFIHSGWSHLLVNMFVFMQFGPYLESIWGADQLLIIYIGGIFAAALPALFKHRENPRYASLGASGAVNSVLFAFIAMQPQSELYLFAIIPLPAWALGALFIFYESRMQRSSQSTGIAHDAHLYGGLWGILCAILLHPEVGQSWLDLLS